MVVRADREQSVVRKLVLQPLRRNDAVPGPIASDGVEIEVVTEPRQLPEEGIGADDLRQGAHCMTEERGAPGTVGRPQAIVDPLQSLNNSQHHRSER